MKKRCESWEPEGNVPPLLYDRLAKGEREKMVTVWNSARMYHVTNVQLIPSDKRFITTITCKILQNRQCQCTETCKMDFCYVLFIYLALPN